MSNEPTPEPSLFDDAARDAEEQRAVMRDREAASALRDPAAQGFFAWVRSFVRSVLESDYEQFWPGNLLRGETIWQWARFEMLDWLHPIEKLLRRILLIEAYALLETQSLPPARPGRDAITRPEAPNQPTDSPPRDPTPRPADDPDHPELWRVSFRTFAHASRKPARTRKRLPLPRGEDGRVISFRFRAVPWPAAPLARRLEAVIRICRKPAPFIRRLAFRLRRAGAGLRSAIVRLCIEKRADRFARDANSDAAGLALERSEIFWSSS